MHTIGVCVCALFLPVPTYVLLTDKRACACVHLGIKPITAIIPRYVLALHVDPGAGRETSMHAVNRVLAYSTTYLLGRRH